MKGLIVLQYNCGNSNQKATRPFFDAATPAEHHVIAVQEPGYNSASKTTYCPKGYARAYQADPTTKTCFFVSKQINEAHWLHEQFGPYVAVLHLETRLEIASSDEPNLRMTIVNVYNPRADHRRTAVAWPDISKALETTQGEVMLLGDFNLHHPAWGGSHTATEVAAERLRSEATARGLIQATPQGESTWKRNNQESVLDLTFLTRHLSDRLIFCGPIDQWALTKDHIPIRIHIDTEIYPPAASQRYAFQKMESTQLVNAVIKLEWEAQPEPLTALQEGLKDILRTICPKARPSRHASPQWSPTATQLLAGVRRARHRFFQTVTEADRHSLRALSHSLRNELRSVHRSNWRHFLETETKNPQKPPNQVLWRMSRWSRRSPDEAQADPHLPVIRASISEPYQQKDEQKAAILAARFFPETGQADLTDIEEPLAESANERAALADLRRRVAEIVKPEITQEQLLKVVQGLPKGKATGPDRIANEVLQIAIPAIAANVAIAISRVLAGGTIPESLKESTTITLKKPGKKDYSLAGSYRPIALENTLGKIVEKHVANLLTQAAEKCGLLPWNQIGARKQRSTTTAVSLLTASVQTAWKSHSQSVVSMLSLDLAGAFDNVSHERLLWILRKKGIPEWCISFTRSFLTGRKTKISFPGYTGEWVTTATGIPQGSPLSPILFLFFISELLEDFQRPTNDTFAFGFVDDTNLIAWGRTAASNCRRLTTAHDRCLAWAKRHGATFAPEKYQLMHFTRQRRHASADLASTVRINGQDALLQTASMRVLGVWVDPKLTWRAHIDKAVQKGKGAFEALSRITASTWGPSMTRSRLLYTAVVRPAMLYGAQAWSTRPDGAPLSQSLIKDLQKVQNQCLRRITGGYKRTPIAALERETGVPPVDLYLTERALQGAGTTRDHPVEKDINRVLGEIWGGRTRNVRQRRRPQGQRERLWKEGERRRFEIQEITALARGPQGHRRGRSRATSDLSLKTCLRKWSDLEWRQRWETQRLNRDAATWTNAWETPADRLYRGLTKPEATALFLLRTEVIGFNEWLSRIGVPDILPRCPCGWPTQTPQHVVFQCSQYDRTALLQAIPMERLRDAVSQPESGRIVAKWLVRSGALAQFRVAQDMAQEDPRTRQGLPGLDSW